MSIKNQQLLSVSVGLPKSYWHYINEGNMLMFLLSWVRVEQ